MDRINNLQQESMLRVGTILRGIYRIDSYLSSGGFGNTYVATNIEFNERYAIKEFFMKGVTQRDGDSSTVSVSNSINQDSFLQQKEKFKKEARRLRQLNNPHIVKVHDLFEENGTAYYVMDYVDGENLAQRQKRTGKPMSEKKVREILPQILDALKSVHDAGIWHLDLKPANIMLDKNGNVKLIDFGASKQLNAQKGGATTSTAISYTNGYAPREQMEQNYDKFGPWTDLYALGATLYNLLTKNHPPLPTDIDDDDSSDKHNVLTFPESTSIEMKRLVVRLMQTNRMKRPQSVEEVVVTSKKKMNNQVVNIKTTLKSVPDNIKDEETIISKSEDKTNRQPESCTTQEIESSLASNEISSTTNSYSGLVVFILMGIALFCLLLSQSKCENNNSWAPVEDTISNLTDTVVCEDEVLNGYYELTYEDGSSFNGYYKNDVREGHGIYKWSNGEEYDGEWKNDTRTGYGTYIWPEKRNGYMFKYIGQFKNNKMEGNGTAYYVGGGAVSGVWKNGELIESDSEQESYSQEKSDITKEKNDDSSSERITSKGWYEKAKNQRILGYGNQAILFFEKAYEVGEPPYNLWSLYEIGMTYYAGYGNISTDYNKAFNAFLYAYRNGCKEAGYMLGICYEFGRGVPKSISKARHYYIETGYSLSNPPKFNY